MRSVFNIQSLQDLEINIDNDTDEVFVNLTKKQLKGVSSVSCTMGVSIEDGKPMMGINRDGLLILGESAAIKSDWDNGKFTDKFGAKWSMLNHHPVMTLISELTNDNLDKNGKVLKSGYATYNIPVALNDKVCVLRVVYQNDSQAYQILGAVKNVPSKSKTRTLRAASRGITPLQKGDRISPILSAIIPTDNVSEQQNIILQKSIDDVLTLVIFTGETFTVDETLALQNETLENGDYYYQFNFNDPLGNQASSEYAYFDVFEGEVLYSDKVKTQDAEETQTESFDENSNNEVTDTTQ